MSDNFETPKSKYKILKEENAVVAEPNKERKSNSAIRFFPLGSHRNSSRIAAGSTIQAKKVESGIKQESHNERDKTGRNLESNLNLEVASSSEPSLQSASNIKQGDNSS